jgi:hypothetical protein
MDSLPPALLDFISMFRPLLRAEVFDSFTYLLCGLHRSGALEVAGNPSLAHRVARAQLVVVQTGKYRRPNSTTPDRGLPPTYF